MNYVIAVFSSRSESLSFASYLRRIGLPAMVVSTPKEAGKTCGLSVKFNYNYFNDVKTLMSRMRFSSFKGFFIEQNDSGNKSIFRG